MDSKKIFIALVLLFSFLSIMALVVNMPSSKDPAVMTKLRAYIPYELTKTVGGLDIIDKRSGERLKVDNAKVYVALDSYTKAWGRSHLRLEGSRLHILDDSNKSIDTMELNAKQQAFVKRFFFDR